MNLTASRDRIVLVEAQWKLTPALGSPKPVMKMKQGFSVIWLFFKINLTTKISIKTPRRELSIDIWLFIDVSLKITKLRSSPVLPWYLKQGLVFTMDLLTNFINLSQDTCWFGFPFPFKGFSLLLFCFIVLFFLAYSYFALFVFFSLLLFCFIVFFSSLLPILLYYLFFLFF